MSDQQKQAKQPARVLHVTYDMGIGGTEQVICQIVDGLSGGDTVCEIVCIEGSVGPLGQRLQDAGVVIHTLDRTPGFDVALVGKIRAICRSRDIDILHCHQYTPYVYGVLAAVLSPVKVVFTEHGRYYPDRYSWKRRIVNPLLGAVTSRIVAISAATADALAHYEWFRRSTIDVLYNGIAVGSRDDRRSRRIEHGIADSTLVYGTISRFDTIKNLPLLVRAFARLAEQGMDVCLLLVGDGEERQSIENLVRQLGVEQNVLFCGYQTDTSSYMSSIDVFLLTSLSEGTSMTLLEAMSMEVCCIVTDVGGNPEIIEDQKSGIVVPSEDLDGLTTAMRTVYADRALRLSLGRGAKERYSQNFALQKMVEQYQLVYRGCLDPDFKQPAD